MAEAQHLPAEHDGSWFLHACIVLRQFLSGALDGTLISGPIAAAILEIEHIVGALIAAVMAGLGISAYYWRRRYWKAKALREERGE